MKLKTITMTADQGASPVTIRVVLRFDSGPDIGCQVAWDPAVSMTDSTLLMMMFREMHSKAMELIARGQPMEEKPHECQG